MQLSLNYEVFRCIHGIPWITGYIASWLILGLSLISKFLVASIAIYLITATSDWPRLFLHPGCFCLARIISLASQMGIYRLFAILVTLLCSLVTSNAVHDYWKCYINVVTRTCLGFYWYIRTLPWALHALGIVRIYQSNPSLPCYNLLMYIYIYIYIYIY